MISRRELLGAMLAAPALGTAAPPPVRIGIMDGKLGLASNPEAARLAAMAGLDSVQVTLGLPKSGEMPLSDTGLQARWREAAKAAGISLSSTYLDALHMDCLKQSSAAPRWIEEGIEITRSLGAPILMLVFFGKCALSSASEERAVVEPLRDACRKAQDAGVVLGFENTISAEDNVRILQQVDSPSLKVWYDIGNSTNIGGFDVPAEIRLLGAGRICEIHVKDKGWLGQGRVDVNGAARAIKIIGYAGTCTLETDSPTGDYVADARRNRRVLVEALAKAGVKTREHGTEHPV